ncbi:MAG: hypothetical protein HY519_01330 [Candidatus Aenigmarchaeota archaeon]|nr:hypothetical protein [Candidatus Aenigmarchaeota archaeon]
MKPLCELISAEILPAARAFIAKRLVETHGFSQQQTAEAMGLTQPAVSQYKRNLRGYRIEIFSANPRIQEMFESLTKRIAQGLPKDEQTKEFYAICKEMAVDGTIVKLFGAEWAGTCEICMK